MTKVTQQVRKQLAVLWGLAAWLVLAGPAWGQQNSRVPEECNRALRADQRLREAEAQYGIASRIVETQAVSESANAFVCAAWAEKHDQVYVAISAWAAAWGAEKYRARSLSQQLEQQLRATCAAAPIPPGATIGAPASSKAEAATTDELICRLNCYKGDCGTSNLNPGIRRCHHTRPSGKVNHRR
jgi:hypothetical protein